MPSELLKGLLNRDSEEVKDRMGSIFKETLTVSAIGYAGYKAFQGSNIVGEVGKLVGGGNREFYRSGENLRRDIASVTDVKRNAKKISLQAFTSSFNVESIMNGAVEDKRAFFATLFDVAKTETSMSDDLKAIIRQGYEATSDLTDEQKARVSALYKSIESDEKTLDNFRRRYSIYSKTKATLSASSKTLTQPAGQVIRESYANINDLNLKSTLDQAKAEETDVIGRLNRLQKLAGKGGKIELVGFDEQGSTNVRSLYARVSFSGNNKTLNVPLYLAKDRNGNIMYRATENLSTRYVAPLKVLNAPELFNSVDLTSVKGGNLSQNKASYSFEEYVFERLDKTFGGHNGSLSNISEREISDFYEFQRSFGVDAPRGMVDSISNITNISGKRFVSHAFAESMAYARSAQSSRFLIAGLESFDPKLHGDIAKRLMQFFPDEVLGEGHSIIARIQDPFSRGQELSFTDIKDRAGRTALNAMARYGRIDEAIQEQTARGFQMVGRYEMASGIKDIAANATFGLKKDIKTIGAAEASELIGISSAAKGVHGVNLASIMLSGKNASTLGLGEGISYFGGTLRVNSSITNTVHDTGLARTSIMEELIAASNDPSKRFLTIGGDGADYTIEDFFKKFGGGSNEVVLGFKDQETAKIVKRKGMESFTLGISETSFESGRTRYHITGEASQYLDKSKMFSSIIKDTTLGITEAQIKKKLKDAGLDENLADRFFRNLNVDIKQTLFHGTDQIKKSPQYLSSQIAGSLKLFGYGTYETVMQGKIGADNAYLAMINEGKTTPYASLDAVPVKERKAAYLKASIQSAIEIIETGADIAGFSKQEQIGRVLGAAQEHSKRFGVENFDDVVKAALTGGDDTYKSSVIKEISKGITFTAQYVSSGGIHTDYGRNLAKVEPRFMNYLYTSLRGNFGLAEDEATKFIGQFLTRQEGIEGRSNAILGMKLTSFGLTKMGGAKFASQIGTLSGVEKLGEVDVRELLEAGEDEAQVKEILSRREGNIIDFEDLIKDKKRLDIIRKELGGKTQIFLPGQSTFDSLRGYVVSKSGENINIESEFSRYITDLTQSIAGLNEAKSDEDFLNNFYGFKVATGSIAKVTGFSLRNSLTGRISGSGTYMGSGIIFGKKPKDTMVGGTAVSKERLSGLYEALEKNKGYVLFQDSQGFLDSMTTYKQAITDQLIFDKFADGDIDEINKEAEKRTGQRMQDFFFGMYGGERSGVNVTAQRNPNVYLAHFMPGIEMVRYDFDEGGDDPVMKLLPKGRQRVSKAAKNAAKLAKLNDAMPSLTVTSWDDFETARNEHWKQRKAASEEKKRLLRQIGYYDVYEQQNVERLTLNKITGELTTTSANKYLPKAGSSLQFGDDADPAVRAYAEMYKAKQAKRGELLEQIKRAESTIIQARNAAFGALEVDPEGNVVMEEVRSYTTADKIDKEIKVIDGQIAATTDDKEKVKLNQRRDRLEARRDNLQKDMTTGKTYYTYNRAKRQVPNDLATARQTLEITNQRIAKLKSEIATSKTTRASRRASAIVRRNIVSNALGYMATTEQGIKNIIKAAENTGDTMFIQEVRELLKREEVTPLDYVKNKRGEVINNDLGLPLIRREISKVTGTRKKDGTIPLYKFIDRAMNDIHAVRRMSIQDSIKYIEKAGKYVGENLPFNEYMKLNGGTKGDFIRTRYYNRDVAVEELFEEEKLSGELDSKRKEVEGRLKKHYAVDDLDAAYKKIQEEYYKKTNTYISIDQIKSQYFDLSDLDTRSLTPREKKQLEKASDAMRNLHVLEENQERIKVLKRLRKSSFENIDRLAGLTIGFDFNEERQVVDAGHFLTVTSVPPGKTGGPVTSTLTSKAGGRRTSITQGMVARYFENTMNDEVRKMLLGDTEYIKTKAIIEEAQAILDEVKTVGNRIDSRPTDERLKDLGEYLKALITDSGGKTLSLLQEEKVIGSVGGGQDKLQRMEILEEAVALLKSNLDSGDARGADSIANIAKSTLKDLVDERGMLRLGTDEGLEILRKNNSSSFFRNMQSYFGLGNTQAEIDLRATHNITSFNDILKNQAYQKEARANFFKSQTTNTGAAAYKSPLDLFLHRAGMGQFRGLFSLEKREIKYKDKDGTQVVKNVLLFGDEAAEFDLNQTRYTELDQMFEVQRQAKERIKEIEEAQKAKFAADAGAAETELTSLRSQLSAIDAEINSNPTTRDAYLELVDQKNLRAQELKTLETQAKNLGYNVDTKLTDDELKVLRSAPANLEGSNALLPELERLTGSEIKTMPELFEAYEAHKGKNITVGGKELSVEEATRQTFFKMLGRHTRSGDVGGGIIYFPQFDVEMDLMRGDTAVGNFASRMDFSRFAIGDFVADIYQIYHDTSDVMKERFQRNAEAFHGLYNTGAEFLIHMKELGKGMEKYGERLGAGSMTLRDFRLDQYEKERILKSVGGLDVQIKVGMMGLAHSMAEESSDDSMQQHFKRIKAGASLIAVAQESLVIKAKHLNIAADVGTEFLTALKGSYKEGTGDKLFKFFEETVFKGTIYDGAGMDEAITLQNIKFTNLPDDSQTAKSLSNAMQSGVTLTKQSLKDTMDIMARTVKEKGYHALGSDSRIYKTLERGDAFNMDQLLKLLSVSMEGGFTGEIPEDKLEEIMSSQKRTRENIAMNMGELTKGGRGYLAAAALGASYFVGVKNSPEVLDAESKFSDMKARESIGGRHLYNMNHKEHGNVSPSRFEEPTNMYNRPINLGETMVTRSSSMRMYGEAPTYSEAMIGARRVVGAGGNAFLGIQDNRMPISNTYITKSIKD